MAHSVDILGQEMYRISQMRRKTIKDEANRNGRNGGYRTSNRGARWLIFDKEGFRVRRHVHAWCPACSLSTLTIARVPGTDALELLLSLLCCVK